jgi:putative alpha-1,2-mannosidase
MYRAFSQKQTWNDVNGKYRDAKENIRTVASGHQMYGGDAFWNSFWNLNGLWSIMSPEIIENWVYTQLEMFRYTGHTGKGPTGIEYSGIMEGSHEMALMAAAWQKGIVHGDSVGNAIYKAMYKNVSKNGKGGFIFGGYGNPDEKTYIRKGYIPYKKAPSSRTLDYAFDDWTVAQMAKAIGKTKDYEMLMERSQNYTNGFQISTNFQTRVL